MRISKTIIICFASLLMMATLCHAQDKIHTLDRDPSYPNQPIEVVSCELGDKPFSDDSTVLGGQDWLKQVTLGIKNVSNKNITAFDLDLWIKKEGNMLTGVSFPILFRTFTKTGVDNARTLQGEKKLGVLQPGEIVKVRISDDHMSKFGAILKKYGAEDVERAKIDIREVFFDDGSRWGFGQYVPGKTDKDVPLDLRVTIVSGAVYTTDDIPLDIVFRNNAEDSVSLLNAFNNPTGKRIFFSFTLRDSDGTPFIGGGGGKIDFARNSMKYIELKKGEETAVRINLTDYGVSAAALKPGIYSVVFIYRNQYGENCFKRTIESEPLTLVLIK